MTPDELDREIQAALEAPPSPEQTARLIDFWRERSRAERRRRRFVQATALAATLAAAAAATLWLVRPGDESTLTAKGKPPREPSRPVQIAAPSPMPPDAAQLAADAADADNGFSAGRPPTGYEQAMFALLTRSASSATNAALAAELDEAIDRFTTDPTADARAWVRSARLAQRGAETMLIDQLARAAQPRQRVIVQLLGECGTARSASALLELAGRPSIRPDALASLESVVGLTGLADAVASSSDAAVRAALMERLLSASSPDGLRGYLLLASDDAFRAEALAVALDCRRLPVDALVASLADDDKSVRLAAALVLGRVDGPRIADALIAAVSGRQRPPVEAWVALLACQDPTAERFLAESGLHPRRLAQVNNARAYWARFVP